MSDKNSVYLTLKDYSVSGEEFKLLYNSEMDMLETFPQPKLENLSKYYESSNYISHTDSKESVVEKLYQKVKRVALKNKLKLINSLNSQGKDILDVGCGTGEFLLTCKNDNWNLAGVEPNTNAKCLAEQKLNKNSTFKIVDDIDKIELQQFDVITLWHVLEHIPNLDEYISKLKLLLKPNGVLIVAVPNYKSFDALYYKKYWAAFDVPRHLWHFSKKSIQLLFFQKNLNIEKILPMYFDSFYVSLLSEKYKSGKNNFIKAFLLGLYSNVKAMYSKEYSSLIYVIRCAKNDI